MIRQIASFPAVASVLLVSSCGLQQYDFRAGTTLDGLTVEVGLLQSHPYLAEYKRAVLIDGQPPVSLGIDSGGYAYINAFETDEQLILQTFHTHVLVVSKQTKQYALEKRALTPSEIEGFIGSFKFVEPETYEFVGREALVNDDSPGFDPKVVKGG